VSKTDTVHTPLTLQLTSGVQAVIHEADLVDYAGMYLGRVGDRTYRASLARWKDGRRSWGARRCRRPGARSSWPTASRTSRRRC
jgi:hypothetical protein